MIASFMPNAPPWSIDWDAITCAFPWVAAMRGVVQDPVHHPEGDVWIHSRMVCEALVSLPAWQRSAPAVRLRLFAAALLHDVAKPHTTVVQEDGRVRSPGHSPRGAVMARGILWRLGWHAREREPVCALVQYHQVPYFVVDRVDARAVVIRLSQSCSAAELAMLCEADVRGRTALDTPRMLDNIALFGELSDELGCLDRPYPFANDHARAMYFHRSDRDPDWAAWDDTRMTVTVMSGLPGAGKSSWVREHAGDQPLVALDRLREELEVDPTEHQAKVIARARELAREHLRAGRSFVWDATNLSRSLRRSVVTLCYDYGARVRIVHVEAPEPVLRARNRARPEPVPDDVIDRLVQRWEQPQRTECHELLWLPDDDVTAR